MTASEAQRQRDFIDDLLQDCDLNGHYERPIFCPKCNKHYQFKDDLCDDLLNMIDYFLKLRLRTEDGNNNASSISGVTIDLDEIIVSHLSGLSYKVHEPTVSVNKTSEVSFKQNVSSRAEEDQPQATGGVLNSTLLQSPCSAKKHLSISNGELSTPRQTSTPNTSCQKIKITIKDRFHSCSIFDMTVANSNSKQGAASLSQSSSCVFSADGERVTPMIIVSSNSEWHGNYVFTLYVPAFNCVSPVCFENSNVLMAHIFCRQLNMLTFRRYDAVANVESLSAIGHRGLTCHGYESVLQQCLASPDDLTIEVCPRLLTIDCAQECRFVLKQRNGTVKSAGYPDHYLPFSDCTWDIIVPADHAILLELLDLHMGMETSKSMQERCSRSHLDLFLSADESEGLSSLNGRVRLCGDSTNLQTFSSSSNRLRIHYVTDAMRIIESSRKGFMLRYYSVSGTGMRPRWTADYTTIPSSHHSNGDEEMDTEEHVTTFIMMAILLLIATASALKHWLSHVSLRRKSTKVRRLNMGVARTNMVNIECLVQRPDRHGYYHQPLYCSKCEQHFQRNDRVCSHLQLLIDQFGERRETSFDVAPEDLSGQKDDVNFSTVSNITIDIEELMSTKEMNQVNRRESGKKSLISNTRSKRRSERSDYPRTSVLLSAKRKSGVNVSTHQSRLYTLNSTSSSAQSSAMPDLSAVTNDQTSSSDQPVVSCVLIRSEDDDVYTDVVADADVPSTSLLNLPDMPGSSHLRRCRKASLREVKTKLTSLLRKERSEQVNSTTSVPDIGNVESRFR
ncbi:unnamed protein product [Soboliphyme baturini]|uniref:CUB domain-containing protein n=1 Tax=Soboliphyme baturini TaxID=241478 RepID=A0A183IUJ3_9BILA|nr:unnamed protein product [Soboliphyme baturini]